VPIADPKQGGQMPFAWIKWFQNTVTVINAAFNPQGVLQGQIGPKAILTGRTGTLQAMLSNVSNTGAVAATSLTGVINPAQLPAAGTGAHGAVQLPPGATTSTLGTAALEDTTAFDAAGSAAAAQAASDPVGSAATAQANAETFASNASNLTSGTVPNARLGGLSVTIVTAQLTALGAQGSMTFTNGILTAQTPAT
jgi:hypothetical protein